MSHLFADSELRSLSTEQARPNLEDLDLLSSGELVELMCSDLHRVSDAVAAAQDSISQTVDAIVDRMAQGGRLIYVGAGTAGRLGMLDAAEAGPTFNVPEGQVVAVLAGGIGAWSSPVEDAEDDSDQGASEIEALSITALDSVIGIAASGRTPFVLGALDKANRAGALTAALVCNAGSPAAAIAQIVIEALVGPEVVAGSTRLNAGTAQKVILNILSTTVMVRLGKTYGPLMVDVRATNAKLRDRAASIVSEITGASTGAATRALEECGWQPKVAAVMLAGGVDSTCAAAELDRFNGRLRPTLAAMVQPRQVATPRVAGASRRLGVAAAFVNGRLIRGDISIRDGVVEALGLPRAGEGVAIPGLLDAQVNGYAGVDILNADTEQLAHLEAALMRDGVMAYQPTLITAPEGDMIAALRLFANRPKPDAHAAAVVGVHLEGPFLSPERAGTHPVEHLRAADVRLLERLLDAGPVTMVTLAPELPGAGELIERCKRRGIVVSLGHSRAQATDVQRALRAGADAVTHLFNAMAPLSARAVGMVGTALSDEGCALQIIADGIHVDDALIRLTFKAGRGRCSLVSDAIAAATLEDGPYRLGGVNVEVLDGVARRADGTLAGSTSTLAAGLARLRKLGIDQREAIAAVTEQPARLLRQREHGRLSVGGPANLVIIDEQHAIQRILSRGVELEVTVAGALRP